ncbi:MAG: hypothetical protein IKX89_01835, partial [Firmicutes bacterium]|nr:hypothetical protein [Bacillota bacterium]
MPEKSRIGSIKLNIGVIVDELTELGWELTANTAGDAGTFINYAIFDDQADLSHQYVYFVPTGKILTFPVHKYAYVSCEQRRGDAPHIRISGKTDIQVINALNAVFQKYRSFEKALSDVLLAGGSLDELSLILQKELGNPLFIHDNMFCILAMPRHVEGMRQFEVDKVTGKQYVPLWLVNEFKFDEDYQKTLSTHGAQFWEKDHYTRETRCLFVNLWEGDYYLGRLIIEEISTQIKAGQILIAEYFALYAEAVM